MKEHLRLVGMVGASALIAAGALAHSESTGGAEVVTYQVTVTNLTDGQAWGKPLVVSHNSSVSIFEVGEPASDELTALAEEGDNEPLATELEMSADAWDVVAGDTPIAPGETRTFEVKTSAAYPLISLAGMLGTTNDTFGAIQDIVPSDGLMIDGNAYDAGTEVNNEDCDFIPGEPCGSPDARATEGAEGTVEPSGGIEGDGDLEEADFDWTNPVIHVEITKVD